MGWERLLAWVTGRVDEQLRLRVEYLVAENRILRGQVDGRLRLTDDERITLATIGKKMGKAALEQIASIVTPETILAWHRKLVAAKFDTSKTRAKPIGRPPIDPAIVELILRMATESPTWGYRRITGELAKLDIQISHQTVKNTLESHGLDPAPQRKSKTSWADFIKSHTDTMLATDFLTTEVWTAFGLVTFYILFFIHHGTRKVYLGGITTNPNDGWMRQAARNLTTNGCGIFDRCRYLIRDRDTKFTSGFDMIFQSVGIEAVKLPARSPNLNSFAERFVLSIKTECFDRMIFFGEASLRHAVEQYLLHYHEDRPHQGIGNEVPFPEQPASNRARDGPIGCDERLGGLLRSYHHKKAA
ncbi:MAG: hypothetical protein KatS3mg104_1531 [Phycisphaerae bacterium]|nr:MAG: hypothetical protein KatS3mg104_1531 [Phycisphaerae bacterium]